MILRYLRLVNVRGVLDTQYESGLTCKTCEPLELQQLVQALGPEPVAVRECLEQTSVRRASVCPEGIFSRTCGLQ
jgi:hypothetical protein